MIAVGSLNANVLDCPALSFAAIVGCVSQVTWQPLEETNASNVEAVIMAMAIRYYALGDISVFLNGFISTLCELRFMTMQDPWEIYRL